MSETEPEWEQLKRDFIAACAQSAQRSRVRLAHELNQLFRRFRQYEKEADWVGLVMEGAALYARQAALFTVQANVLELRSSLNLSLPPGMRIATQSAPAFDAVCQSKETVTALRAECEVGVSLQSAGQLAYLFPIFNAARVAAVLFVASEAAEVNQLELLANMASSALERRPNPAMLAIAPLPTAAAKPPQPAVRWSHLPVPQRLLHSQASRFARVTVAEMELSKPAACQTARQHGDLYVMFAREIDRARDTYKQRFMDVPSMVDYFHEELVGSMLGGDATKLGADYPGEL